MQQHAKVNPSLSNNEMTLNRLTKQLDKLIAFLNPEECKSTLLILQTYFKNIYLYPQHDAYCQIKLSNKTFYNKIWKYPDGEVFMKMSGWEVEGDYVKLKDALCIHIVLQLLKKKLESSHIQKEFQGVLTVSQFDNLISAVLSKDTAAINKLVQYCGVSDVGRVYCQNGSSINLLMAAVATHHSEMVELLVDYYDVNPFAVDPDSNNPRPCIFQIFHQAPENFIIEFLAALGFINVCIKTDGFTLVHTAVLTNALEALAFLYENYQTIRPNDTDDKKRTSLHLAYLYGNAEMAEFLLDIGADETALDIYGKRPFNYINGDPKLVAYSKYVHNTRKIHDDSYSIEYNYYIKLLKHGIDPEQAVSLTMKEFTWLEEENPTRPRRTDRDKILKDLAQFLIDRPINSMA